MSIDPSNSKNRSEWLSPLGTALVASVEGAKVTLLLRRRELQGEMLAAGLVSRSGPAGSEDYLCVSKLLLLGVENAANLCSLFFIYLFYSVGPK